MECLYGLCVSQGNAIGKVQIVNSDTFKSNNIPPNCILVMKSLDRNLLINLNKNVIGVISEHGNIGSHGAGILRQLKIPCIIRIKDAISILHNGDVVELCDTQNCIKCTRNISSRDLPETFGIYYNSYMKEEFNISDISTNKKWTCSRPERSYQKLRFDIIKEVYGISGTFLFGLEPAQVRQNNFGAIIAWGTPSIPDICTFVINNPDWLIKMSRERTLLINNIHMKLEQLMGYINDNDIQSIEHVFSVSTNLYRDLFKYSYMSQAISDEILEIYLDFIGCLHNKKQTKDILSLTSDYVQNCLNSGIDPGVSQTWKSEKATPHIWYGTINYDHLPLDPSIVELIYTKYNHEKLLKDYNSFRIIVPLVYQLSEEFFYTSSSINSFINWSIVSLCGLASKSYRTSLSVEEFYEKPLLEIINIMKDLGR